ncbi:filamentous hemagglutinin-like protein [Caballeronia catudaia]|uniref:Filamentous hemagglutinin-like protein n=1 Tax=Caballeronia catudaia TaxID=1777136 RepID=A0A158D237_9BURK|nr:filamentous hemagglutinin N-terminal domain-containing protein [Caballeronia catudaia]SAK88715.1 filamentous hemagglutinin-like protein [Caballeronia catudaia]
MSDSTCLRTRKHRRAWDRAIRRFARRAARHAGADLKATALLPLLVFVAAPGAFALPVGEQVQSGNVTINRPNTSSMTINQGSQKGIVNWNGFSIAGNERVDISQPSAQAVLLNRVVGSDASRIAGQLNANGRVFLVNPAGVVFAPGASVNVGSLVASTLGITNDEFLAGKYHFNQNGAPNAKVSIEKGANIAASPGGAVALLGAQVDNSGYVSATLGKIAIGAGSDITLDFAGDGLTMLKVNKDVANALISNSGTVQADDGQIVMSVRAADAATASVLNQTGTVRARSIETRNGRIVLDGGATGVTEIGGTLDATAPGSGTGGHIDVTGFHVAVNDGARIDASGAQGGGRVRVGGGAAGKESDIRNADAVWMGAGAQARADALVHGDGGNVVFFGTQAARVHGKVTARGGANGGNGGLIETSALHLDVPGDNIDASAPHGAGGTWLLDPFNVIISNIRADGNPTVDFTATADDTRIWSQAINAQLNGGVNVTVSTGTSGAQPGNITLEGPIAKTSGSSATLTLNAAGSIIAQRAPGATATAEIVAFSDTSAAAKTGPLNVVLNANTAGLTDGTAIISLGGTPALPMNIFSNGGFITIGVPQQANGIAPAVVLANAIVDSRAMSFTPPPPPPPAVIGVRAALLDLSPRTVVAPPNLALQTVVPDAAAQSGAITINGNGPATNPAAGRAGVGVAIGGNSEIAATTGAVTLTGIGTAGGVSLGAVTVSTAGNIAIDGTASAGRGVDIGAATGAALESTNGAVTLTGRGTSGGVVLNATDVTALSGVSVSGTASAGVGVSMIGGAGPSIVNVSAGPLAISGTGTAGGVSMDTISLSSLGDLTINGTSAAGVGVALTNTGAESNTGSVTVHGSGGAGGVRTRFGSFSSDEGGVTIDGTSLASGASARADGVAMSQTPIDASGAIAIRGLAALQGPLGAGVTILSAAEGTLTLSSGTPGIRIEGSGNGYSGVAIGNDVPAGTARTVFFNADVGPAFTPPLTILGTTNGAPVPGGPGAAGVSIANALLNGSDVTLAGSVSGTSAAHGLDIENSSVTATRTLSLRASNLSPATSSIQVGGNTALGVPAGTLVLAPGVVTPGASFAVAAADAAPINIGVPGVSGPGYTLDAAFGGRFAAGVANTYIGSASHTGRIALGAVCAAAGCASVLPGISGELSIANAGAGSQGIALSGASGMNRLTLDSAGTISEGAAGIQTNQLLLAGPGRFALTSPANAIGQVSFAGTGDTSVTGLGRLVVAPLAGNVFNARGNALAPVTTVGGASTLTGDLTLTSSANGNAGAGTITTAMPMQSVATRGTTLTMRAADTVSIGYGIASVSAPLNIVADAVKQVIVGGAGGSRIAIQTNGGNVTLGTQGGGATGFDGASVTLRLADIDTRIGAPAGAPAATGGVVTIHGVAQPPIPGNGDGAGPLAIAPFGVELDGASIASGSGRIELMGQSLNPAVNPGDGVVLRNASRLANGAGGIDVYGTGSGAGSAGVALLDGSTITSAGGAIDIRGANVGAGAGAEPSSPAFGVALLHGSIDASAPGGAVSIAGSTTTADAGIAYGAVPLPVNAGRVTGPFSITTGSQGRITLRASNDATATSLVGRSGPGSISTPGGSVFVSPATVDPATFGVAQANAVPITLFGAAATHGLSIDAATYRTFSTGIQTLVLGSSTQSGRIVVEGPCAGGAGCAARPAVATSLTLQSTGAGSAGIDLPSGLALPAKTLALASAGSVTDPGGVQAQTLLLTGGGDFDLADAGNDVKTLALSGARDVKFSTPGGFTIDTASANGLDGATGALTTLGGTRPFVTGNLTAISQNGAIALGTPGAPAHLSAGGSIDLVMQNAVFDNESGGTLAAGNAWRVWALARDGRENRNGIDPGGALPNFYGCLYGGVCGWNGQPSQNVVPADGNHFIYAERPTATITIGDQTRGEGSPNAPFGFDIGGLLGGDQAGSAILVTRPPGSSATATSLAGAYSIDGTFSSQVGYNIVVVPGTLTVTPLELQGAVFNRTGLQPLFTAQEQTFVYESNTGAVNICVGTNEPILALQQSEGEADTLAAEWKRVRSRPNLNNCLVVNGQHGCGEF